MKLQELYMRSIPMRWVRLCTRFSLPLTQVIGLGLLRLRSNQIFKRRLTPPPHSFRNTPFSATPFCHVRLTSNTPTMRIHNRPEISLQVRLATSFLFHTLFVQMIIENNLHTWILTIHYGAIALDIEQDFSRQNSVPAIDKALFILALTSVMLRFFPTIFVSQ